MQSAHDPTRDVSARVLQSRTAVMFPRAHAAVCVLTFACARPGAPPEYSRADATHFDVTVPDANGPDAGEHGHLDADATSPFDASHLADARIDAGTGRDGGSASGDSGEHGFGSPVRVAGQFNRMNACASTDRPLFSPRELSVMTSDHYAMLVGLDGHGLNFDVAAIESIRNTGYPNPVLCFITGSLVEEYRGPRFTSLDDHEDAFLHAGDPASATIIAHPQNPSARALTFRQDMRILPHFIQGELYCDGVTEASKKPITSYVVRSSTDPDGPYATLVAEIAAESPLDPYVFYRFDVPSSTPRDAWIRVFSRYSTGAEVTYSDPIRVAGEGGNVRNDGDTSRPVLTNLVARRAADVAAGVDFVFECVQGYACPPADELAVVIDTNHDGHFQHDLVCAVDADGTLLSTQRCEALVVQRRETIPRGQRYTARLAVPRARGRAFHGFRVVRRSTGEVLAPFQTVGRSTNGRQTVEASYVLAKTPNTASIGTNNRITLSLWGGPLVKRDHPEWIRLQSERLGACLSRGYDGMKVDFHWDSLRQPWFKVAALPPGYDEREYADSGVRFLEALQSAHPSALIDFNGTQAFRDPQEVERYATTVGMLEFEFFMQAGDPLPPPDAFSKAYHYSVELQKRLILASGNSRDISGALDVTTRLDSLAAYLLLLNDNLYYYYVLDPAYQEVVLFPEWKVNLGGPTRARAEAIQANVYARQFENGLVLVNNGASEAAITLPEPLYRVGAEGGLVPELRPNSPDEFHYDVRDQYYGGRMTFERVNEVRIATRRSAMFVRELPAN